MIRFAALPGVFRFAHEAMNATFEVFVAGYETRYAEQASWAAFKELDSLERELSRYVENSDVSRLNEQAPGTPLVVSPETFECLQLSGRLYAETNKAFDVTVGSLLACWRGTERPSPEKLEAARARTGMHLLALKKHGFTVEKRARGVRVDLGGIGKGYALDQMAEVLREWSVKAALLVGGRSSVLALEPPSGKNGWPLTVHRPGQQAAAKLATLTLVRSALGASGLAKGLHIIDPRTGQPAVAKRAAWSRALTGARADALSTAFMVMRPEEIKDYCVRRREVGALLVMGDKDERVLRYGTFA